MENGHFFLSADFKPPIPRQGNPSSPFYHFGSKKMFFLQLLLVSCAVSLLVLLLFFLNFKGGNKQKIPLDSTNAQLVKLTQEYEGASDKDKAKIAAKIAQTSLERKKKVEGLVGQNKIKEALVLSLSLPTPALETIQKVAPQNAEKTYNKQGTLHVTHIDYKDDKESGDVYLLEKDKSMDRLRLASVPAVESGTQVTVDGVQWGDDVLVNGVEASKVQGADISTGEQTMAVILLYWQDQPAPDQAAVSSYFTDRVNFSKNFFASSSYGKASLKVDTYGFLKIPKDIGPNCSDPFNPLISISDFSAAASSVVNLNNYQHVYFIVDCSAWWGWNAGKYSVATTVIDDRGFTHEIGHSFGANHSNGYECGTQVTAPSGCVSREYGDPYSLMGSTDDDFDAYHKDLFQWFDSSNLLTMTSSGPFKIGPIETGGNINALRVPRARDRLNNVISWYYVELRDPVGNDSKISPKALNGALIHSNNGDGTGATFGLWSILYDNTPNSTSTDPTDDSDFQDASLVPGKTFNDADAGVGITINTATNSELSGNVTMTQPKCVQNTPTVSINPYLQIGTPGQTLTYQLTIQNNDISCTTPAVFNLSAVLPAELSSTFGQISVDPGATKTVDLNFTSSSSASLFTSYLVTVNVTRDTNTSSVQIIYVINNASSDKTTDSDADGFTDYVESYIGTDASRACGENAWPPDFNNDQKVDDSDNNFFVGHYGVSIGDPRYNNRLDLNADGNISSVDLSLVAKYKGQTCTIPTPMPTPLATPTPTATSSPPAGGANTIKTFSSRLVCSLLGQNQKSVGIYGQDGGVSTAFGGQSYFMFGDITGSSGNWILPNSLSVTGDTNAAGCMTLTSKSSGSTPLPLFGQMPALGEVTAWPLSWVDGPVSGSIYFYYASIDSSGTAQGIGLARMNTTDYSTQRFGACTNTSNCFLWNNNSLFGTYGIKLMDARATVSGSDVYVFTSVEGSGGQIGIGLMKVAASSVANNNFSDYQFWNGSSFVSGFSNVAPIWAAGNGLLWLNNVAPFTYSHGVSVRYNGFLKKWVATYNTGILSVVNARISDNLTGPWSSEQTLVHCDQWVSGASGFLCYGGAQHPQYANGPIMYETYSNGTAYQVYMQEIVLATAVNQFSETGGKTQYLEDGSSASGYKNDGTAFYVSSVAATDIVPIYDWLDSATGVHLYETASPGASYNQQGIAFYAKNHTDTKNGLVPIYRWQNGTSFVYSSYDLSASGYAKAPSPSFYAQSGDNLTPPSPSPSPSPTPTVNPSPSPTPTPIPKIGDPSNLVATATCNGSSPIITFSWQDNSNFESGFWLDVSGDPFNSPSTTTVSPSVWGVSGVYRNSADSTSLGGTVTFNWGNGTGLENGDTDSKASGSQLAPVAGQTYYWRVKAFSFGQESNHVYPKNSLSAPGTSLIVPSCP